MKRATAHSRLLAIAIFSAGLLARFAEAAPVDLFVDSAHPAGAIDLTRYALGQGGLAHEPMFGPEVGQIAALHPQTIRLFVQEYFNLYPAHGKYHWETLDRSIENILATGAKPLLCLCFKPRVLFPEINQDIVQPTDYAEWDTLIEAMVRHCNQEKRYGIQYWEVGNEVDIGESGGCPYRFQPREYTNYYAHTARAIRRADPAAKVGGPTLANWTSPIGDALIDFCGNGGAPLDFFSWHVYGNDPMAVRRSIRAIKEKLGRYPRLAATETIIDEWNIGLIGNEPTPGFQAAFVLETTSGFLAEGLSRAAYYHIRDYFVSPEDFTWMSPSGYNFMSDWWNHKIQNSGLFDNQGRRRPAYYVFQMLAQLRGLQLPVTGSADDVHALAVRNGNTTHIVFWNFPLSGSGATAEVTLRFPANQPGQFRLVQLNPVANRLDTVRAGAAAELDAEPPHLQLAPYGVAWAQVGELKAPPADSTADTAVEELANEVHDKGWIVFSAKSPAGNWDLYVMRPDGSERRALTSTPEFNEAGPRVSPDGKRLLYYRLPRGEPVNMTYGTRDLVIADANGRNPIVFGSQYPWASWGPDSDQIACLKPAGAKPPGIEMVDIASRKVVREISQRDYTRQLVWSPDGQWFLGTANNLGEYWNIGRLSFKTGQINVASETDRYNCTPDWAPDSQHAVYARGINPATEKNGHAEMWWASGDGRERKMLFAEGGRHLYGAFVSPDGKYCIFTRSTEDFGDNGDVSGFTMALMRLGDAPMIGDQSASLRQRYPDARTGPWLNLGPGWEPYWTAADMNAPQKTEQR